MTFHRPQQTLLFPSNLTIILVVLFCCFCPTISQAQIIAVPEVVWSHGTLYMDGEKVTRKNAAEFLDPTHVAVYRKGQGEMNTGKTLFFVSGGLFANAIYWEVTDLISINKEINRYGKVRNTHIGGLYALISAGAGAIAGITGGILYKTGRTRKKWVEEDMRASGLYSSIEVDFGLTSNGIGLALHF